MRDSSQVTRLVLRIHAAEPQGTNPAADAERFRVSVSLDLSGWQETVVSLPVARLKTLESNPWEYGALLGEALLSDPNLARFVTYAQGRNPERVFLRLEIDAASTQLHSLLWERLIGRYAGPQDVFATSPCVSLVRGVPKEFDESSPPRQGPFRLILAIASPRELSEDDGTSELRAIDLAVEINSLDAAWRSSMQAGLLDVTILARVGDELREKLQARGYTVQDRAVTLEAISDTIGNADGFHIICHGTFRPGKGSDGTGQASLLLEDRDGFQSLKSEAEILPKLADPRLRLVFLQACKSASRAAAAPNFISGLAPKIALGARAVIGMQDFVRIEDAQRFSQEFYETLLATGYAEIAVNSARRALYAPTSHGWAIPALYLAPNASPLWEPDRILASVQELAARFRVEKSVFLERPFPVDAIRHTANIPLDMETSPAGPRVPLTEAVAGILASKRDSMPVILVVGGSGRGKTAQVYKLHEECARKVSSGGPLPLFVRISSFQPEETAAPFAVARAVARTYRDLAQLEMDEGDLRERFGERCVLLVDGDEDVDVRCRNFAFDALLRLSATHPGVAVVATTDASALRDTGALRDALERDALIVLLVQLLTPSSLGQYLRDMPGGKGDDLHSAIRGLNLFDIASVPWLLSSIMTQANRIEPAAMSRSGVIGRVVESNLSTVSWPQGTRQLVPEFLAKLAWTLQKQRESKLSGSRLYRLLAEVRGAHDISMEQLRTTALQTRIVCPSQEDGVRFAYPGLQSYWCAKRIVRMGARGDRELDDITAMLGRRSRVRMWQDVLVLLAGITNDPGHLVESILAGGELGYGEQVFVAATCAHEARLTGKTVAPPLISQMLDSLIWRSTVAREHSGSARVRAVEALGLLGDERAVPHLVSLVIDPVRPGSNGELTFELSGLRQAAIQVLLSMSDATRRHVADLAAQAEADERSRELAGLIEAWIALDDKRLLTIFEKRQKGVPAVVAFALSGIGGPGNLDYLMNALLDPACDTDTRWALADALLMFNAHDVMMRVCEELAPVQSLLEITAYMVGKLQVASVGGKAVEFLESCLKADSVKTQGLALRSLAELGNSSYLRHCEWLAVGDWEKLNTAGRIARPATPSDELRLRRYALDALRLIGDSDTMKVLRDSHSRPSQNWAGASQELTQLSYLVTEDIYWRMTGGKGEFSVNCPPVSENDAIQNRRAACP